MTIVKETLAGKIAPGAEVEMRFSAAGLPEDAYGRLALTSKGRYRVGKNRGTLLAPEFFPAFLRAKLGGANADSFKFRGGFATDGTTPTSLGTVRFALGPAFSRTVAGGQFRASRDVFRHTEVSGKTKVSIAIDFRREIVIVTATRVELGELDAPTADLVFDAGVGAGTFRSTVRLSSSGAKRGY
jgi:hypothetical protein